jgi:hypothetical protein
LRPFHHPFHQFNRDLERRQDTRRDNVQRNTLGFLRVIDHKSEANGGSMADASSATDRRTVVFFNQIEFQNRPYRSPNRSPARRSPKPDLDRCR